MLNTDAKKYETILNYKDYVYMLRFFQIYFFQLHINEIFITSWTTNSNGFMESKYILRREKITGMAGWLYKIKENVSSDKKEYNESIEWYKL